MLKANTVQEISADNPVAGEADKGLKKVTAEQLEEASDKHKETVDSSVPCNAKDPQSTDGVASCQSEAPGTAEENDITTAKECVPDASKIECELPGSEDQPESDGKSTERDCENVPGVQLEQASGETVKGNDETKKDSPVEDTEATFKTPTSANEVAEKSASEIEGTIIEGPSNDEVKQIDKPLESPDAENKERCNNTESAMVPSNINSSLEDGVTTEMANAAADLDKTEQEPTSDSVKENLSSNQQAANEATVQKARQECAQVAAPTENSEPSDCDPISYGPLGDDDMGQVDSTDAPNEIQAMSDGAAVTGQFEASQGLNDASVFMMEDGSTAVLSDASIQQAGTGVSNDLNGMEPEGVTLSLPDDDSVLGNNMQIGNPALMAPDIDTEGNPGTRVLLLQRQTDDGSLIQEYVEVPNVTDGEGNLIVYDEMGNQYIIPPSQAEAEPPITEEVVTNETEVITTGEDHLMADGLVLEDVELPVAQESPDDSTDHVVVERLQYQDVSFVPSIARNDVQMSVEIGEEDDESDVEMSSEYISNDVNHVVAHHSELLDHDLGHGDLSTSVPFDPNLSDLAATSGLIANAKKRKRQKSGAEGKPALPRKRKKKPKEEIKLVSDVQSKLPERNVLTGSHQSLSDVLSYPRNSGVLSGFRSSFMPVSPIRIPVPEMSEDCKDATPQKVPSCGSSMLSSPTLQPPTSTPSSQKSHSPIQNKHPTIASLLFKSSVSPAVSPRSSSSSPFNGAVLVSPSLPANTPVLLETTTAGLSLSDSHQATNSSAKTSGVVEQVCKMLPVGPPEWQPQYTTAQQGSPFVTMVSSPVGNELQRATQAVASEQDLPGVLPLLPAMPQPQTSIAAAPRLSAPFAVSTASPILKVPMVEQRAQGPVPSQPYRSQLPEQTQKERPIKEVQEIQRPELSNHIAQKISPPVSQPHATQVPILQPQTGAPAHQSIIGNPDTGIQFTGERLPPPYPGHSKANKQIIPASPNIANPTNISIQNQHHQHIHPQQIPAQKQQMAPPMQVAGAVLPPSATTLPPTVLTSNHGELTPVAYVNSTSYPPQYQQIQPVIKTSQDIVPVRLPVLPPGKIPPLMFPPGVLPPPHLIRGVPPGHAVPIELIKGQRPALISPTGHILIPTDQLHLLQQGRLLPRPLFQNPPPLLRAPPPTSPQITQQVIEQVISQEVDQVPVSIAGRQQAAPAEPIGLVPAPVTPTMLSPRTPDTADDQRSMEAELVHAAHMAEVGSSPGQMQQLTQQPAKSNLEACIPNLPTLTSKVRQPPTPGVRNKQPKQTRQQHPSSVQPNQLPTSNASRRPQEDGGTLVERYMKDWQPTGRFKCKFCHYSSVTQNFLFRHWVMSHSGVKPYLCAFCNLKSPTKDGITRHQTAKHKELPREVLIDMEQEKLLVRKFRKVFTSLVPYRYHDYVDEDQANDGMTSDDTIDNNRDSMSPNEADLTAMNNLGKSHENSKGITETYIYSEGIAFTENSQESHSEGHEKSGPSYEVDGQRQGETKSYPGFKKKMRESFEGQKETSEDKMLKLEAADLQWANEEPTSRLSELAGIALSSQAPPPHTIESSENRMAVSDSYNRKDQYYAVSSGQSVKAPVSIHPALQRPPIMLPPLNTIIRPHMVPADKQLMMHSTNAPQLARDAAAPLPAHYLSPESQQMNFYDKEMLQSMMAKHKDAQTIVQLLVSQKRDLPPDLQLPSQRKEEYALPGFMLQPPPAHQPKRSIPMSTLGLVAPPAMSMPQRALEVSIPSSEAVSASQLSMAGMLKSPVNSMPAKMREPAPYNDLPLLVPQKTYSSSGVLPPITELRGSANHSSLAAMYTVASNSELSASNMRNIGAVSSSSAASVLLAAAAAVTKSDSGVREQDQMVGTSSEALSSSMSSSPQVTSTSEDLVDSNSNRTGSEDLQLKRTNSKTQMLLHAAPHSSSSPDQSQDSMSSLNEVRS